MATKAISLTGEMLPFAGVIRVEVSKHFNVDSNGNLVLFFPRDYNEEKMFDDEHRIKELRYIGTEVFTFGYLNGKLGMVRYDYGDGQRDEIFLNYVDGKLTTILNAGKIYRLQYDKDGEVRGAN